jgi:hypothetical protein
LEQTVASELGVLAPFVAIGEPGESYPDFGATRAYFEGADDAWQSAVRDWMDRAAIIVLVPGLTAGLGWELEQVFRGGYDAKLVMVLPADRPKARRARMSAAKRLCSDPKWRRAFEIEPNNELLAVFLGKDRKIIRVTCTGPREEELRIALGLAALSILDQSRVAL